MSKAPLSETIGYDVTGAVSKVIKIYKVKSKHDFGRHLGRHLTFLREPKVDSKGLLVCKHILKNSA